MQSESSKSPVDSLIDTSKHSDMFVYGTGRMLGRTKVKAKKTTKKQMQALTDAAECLRILAHPHRLRIVQLLLSGECYSVNELADVCGIAQPVASDHLRLMHRCGFLKSQKDGRTVHYSIAEPHLAKIMACVESKFMA